jgi:hypothetical protein
VVAQLPTDVRDRVALLTLACPARRLYTSAPDAEGTLGGLVHLGQSSELGPILRWALERSGLCSSDPLGADYQPDAATSAIHGAACHACLSCFAVSWHRAGPWAAGTRR